VERKQPLLKDAMLWRKKVLNDFTVEDLGIMTGQNIGLDYLVPLAIGVLSDDLFAKVIIMKVIF